MQNDPLCEKRPLTRLDIVRDNRNADAARKMRASLFQRCRAAIEQVGDEISGFALVVWDKEGNLRSAYDASCGPISAPLVPTFVADALNRHIAVMIAEARRVEEE